MATGGVEGPQNNPIEDDFVVNKLTCAICLEKYRRPKLLLCCHTFCQSCIQSLAGCAPSFSCPSCRTVILLPAGGVAALQNNFYIEADLGIDTSSPPRRLCDICAEDREATHTCLQCRQRFCSPCRRVHDSITSCRSHTVVSLQAEDSDSCKEGATPRSGRKEEMCHKHRDQRVVLHCKACSANICIQCKLTLHDGHRTEDLVDTEAKAKADLQAMLESLSAERRRLEAVLSAVDQKRSSLKDQQAKVERRIHLRADTLLQWLNQSRDEAVQSVQSTTSCMEEKIQNNAEHIRDKHATLSAQCSHVTRVLREDNEADIVTLKSQLYTVTLTGIDADVEKLLLPLPPLTCRHDSTAVNPVMMRAFVGLGLDVVSHVDLEASASADDSSSQRDNAVIMPLNSSTGEKAPPRKLVYSTDKTSTLIAICLTSKDRLWVCYSLDADIDSDVAHLKLLGDKGEVVELNTKATASEFMVTALNSVTLMLCSTSSGITSVKWIQPGGNRGESHNIDLQVQEMIMSAATGCYYMSFPDDSGYFRVRINSVNPSSWTRHVIMEKDICPGSLRDVSAQEKYLAYVVGNEAKVFENKGPADIPQHCVYQLSNTALDARFCLIDGEEMLSVIADDDDKVHIVDYKNGGNLYGYLSTKPVVMKGPGQLITDYNSRLWIGCNGGEVVVVDL